MSQCDFNDPAYESDEYYDEMGRKVREFDYSVESEPWFVKKGEPVQDIVRPGSSGNSAQGRLTSKHIDFAADDPDCGNFSPVVIKKEVVEVKQDATPSYVPIYTVNDLTPTIRDPRCQSATQLPCFWPVYVGNFRCVNRNDEFDSVKEYFAWKGLYVCWWFRKIDSYYDEFQSKAGIYDMLVYFASEQDANYAIRHCHRDIYKGYPINVFPGREPVYFDPRRSLWVSKMKSGRIYSELFFEKRVKFMHNVIVTCAVKFHTKRGAMEFATPIDMSVAKTKERLFKFEHVPTGLQKQRFLEQDLLYEIDAYLKYNPDALKANLEDRYVKLLLQNKRPVVDPNPNEEVVPLRVGPPRHVMHKHLQQKIKKNKKQIVKALQEGRNPRCFSKSRTAKERFKKMVQSIETSGKKRNF